MPFLYIYSPSDFVSGLPDESGAMAAGTPTFTLTLKVGATPTLVEVSDDDLVFDEVDAGQTLTNAITLDGTSYAAGTSVNTAYDLINTATGAKVTSLHFGGDGYQQGAVNGLVSTVELTPGSSYTFNTERTSHQKNNAYDDYFACFVSGTHILTSKGPVAVENLKQGDLIETSDGSYSRLQLLLSRRFSTAELQTSPKLRPIRIMADTLGESLPKRDLLISPQHRMLAKSVIAKRMLGTDEVFISATKLTALPGIFVDTTEQDVTYFHLVLDKHHVIFAEGAPTESFYCGPNALKALSTQALEEIRAIFPSLLETDAPPLSARPTPKGAVQKHLLSRHLKNSKPLIAYR